MKRITGLIAIVLFLVNASGVADAQARRECEPFEELRCVRGIDRATCRCIGEDPPRPADACGSISTSGDAQRCYDQRVRQFIEACARGGTSMNYWDQLSAWASTWSLRQVGEPRCP